MTNAPEGRTYMKKEWVLDPDIASGKRPSRHHHRYYDEDEYIVKETPFVVPNGKWVMEKPSYPYWMWLVGIDHSELEQVTLHTLYGRAEVLYIGDKPFGYICVEEEDVDQSVHPAEIMPGSRKTLVYARQVHKGELGQGVHIPTPDYVRQPDPSHKTEGRNARARRHGQRGWVKLADLGKMSPGVGYDLYKQVDLVLGYWQFSGHRNYQYYENDQDGGQLVDVAWGSSRNIKLGNAKFENFTRTQFVTELFRNANEVWIRRGFAYTILRLQALGVQPEVAQPA